MTRTPPSDDGMRLQRSGVLVDRAIALLSTGPQSTPQIARQVLGLSGNVGVAARAVFELLGDDPRFRVDAQGIWALTAAPPAAAEPGHLLRVQQWVVVDVETTGGTPNGGHRVTEVAAVVVSGGEIVDVYSSLVNPQRPIPSMITGLTGITNQMVANAPTFGEIAQDFEARLRGRVFVAHNAAFDWSFVSSEMDRCWGVVPAGRQLCTVRLARKLLPHLMSRSLGALAVHFGLEIESHHRAADDAVATAKLLLRFVEMLEEREITRWSELDRLLRGRAQRRRPQRTPRSMDQA